MHLINKTIKQFKSKKGFDRLYIFRIIFGYLKTKMFYSLFFKYIGSKSIIYKPLKVNGSNNISIGNNVVIESGTWIAAMPLTNETASLVIDDGAVIGHFNHIYATKNIYIGKNVLTADKVYISDNLHSYENIFLPIIKQPIKQISEVSIGDGAWLGENVCIIGASIGKNCVIGANSVVTKDVKDYSIAVGSPAKIIKRYCLEDNIWKKTKPNGDFYEE